MITVSLVGSQSSIGKVINSIGAKCFPFMIKAVRSAANEVLTEWVEGVRKASSKDGWKKKYAESIQIQSGNNPLEASVSATGMYVNFVETGVKSFSIKRGLLSGEKAKTNADGKKYAVIFMRKGGPNSQGSELPGDIYEKAKKLKYKGSLQNIGTSGMSEPQIKKMQKRKWKSGMFEGLTKTGRRGHTQYGTFRIITEKSKGWIYPAVAASPVFEKMVKEVGPKIQRIMHEGLVKDLETGLKTFNKKTGIKDE